MAINLTKGQTINLSKDTHDLSSITLGLGWKIREKKSGVLNGLFGEKKDDEDFDLDAVAFLLDGNNRVTRIGDSKLVGGDIVFFNSLHHFSGAVRHTGDERQGGSGDADDEQIVVRLDALPEVYHRILFLVCIYQGQQKKQHFGMVNGAYIRAVDAKGKEIARYSLDSEPSYEGRCTMVFGDVCRNVGGWKFSALGDAHPFDSFVQLLKNHIPQT